MNQDAEKKMMVVSTKAEDADTIRQALGFTGEVICCKRLSACLESYRNVLPAVVFIHENLLFHKDKNRLKQRLSGFWQAGQVAPVIVLASKKNSERAVRAVKAGASGYMTVPPDPDQLKAVVQMISGSGSTGLKTGFASGWPSRAMAAEMLKTRSAAMGRMYEKIRLVAPIESTVLLTGETGTGKGVMARLLHACSGRSRQPMVSVHCGAIPETLIESELFGHEKGAFTGAIRRKRGKIEAAGGGTLFLDEIGTITAAIQIKLLQVLQDRTYQPVGSENTLTTGARVVAASNRDLEEMCREKEFRTDLYYRLNVFPVKVPPLRERREDIPLFLDFYLKQLNMQHGKRIGNVSPEVVQALDAYEWPGNVRELENLVQRAYILETGPTLTPKSFPQELFVARKRPASRECGRWPTLASVRRKAVDKAESEYLCSVLAGNRGRINQTAEIAGVSRRQIHKLLTQYKIRKEDFR